MTNKKVLKNITLSILLLLCLASMFLTWFGGSRGVSEVRGTIVLNNPLTIMCIIVAAIGIWSRNRKSGRKLTIIGLCGICIMEVYYFLTWHIETISGEFNLSTSLSMAFPEFYMGLGITFTVLVTGIVLLRKEKYNFLKGESK